LYHAVLRRGVFWYYLQDSDLRPAGSAETEQVCAPLYQPDRRTLLFRLVRPRPPVALEGLPAPSDGTGARWVPTDRAGADPRGGPARRGRRPAGAPGRERATGPAAGRGGQPSRGSGRGGGARADHGLLRPLLPHPAPAARPLLARAGLHPRGRTGRAHRRGG